MSATYNSWLVGLSLLVAVVVSYTSLRLASRVATSERRESGLWLTIGALAMGVGIWSMHFVGMLAFSLPIPLAYSVPTTLISLAAAIVTSGFALGITSGERLTLVRLGWSALAMGAGISVMHYLGMAAIPITPRISYDPLLVLLSIAIAVGASFAALWLFFRLRDGSSRRRQFERLGAALAMGLAISGMHYIGMAASRFAPGSFCTGGVALQNSWLAASIGIFALGLLAVTLVTSVYDAHLQSRVRVQAQKLERANAELQHQATHDALTGLPNRTLFLDRLEREVTHARRDGRSLAVLAVDLDRFKLVNDTLGHGVGDELLIEISRRLLKSTRSADTVARTGGDEFLLLVPAIHTPADAAMVAVKILAELGKPLRISGTDMHSTASVGISVFPDDGMDVDSMVAHSDEAMYFAKQNGRNCYKFFSAGMSVFSRDRLHLECDLRRALPMNEFAMYYQPKLDVATGRMNSVEALLRWRHPTRGMIAALEFIPLAEESGLIFCIGEWALREACRQARAWQQAGLAPLRVAVNISPIHFKQPSFLSVVQAALLDHDLEPQYLEIELTETTVMDHAETSIQILEELSRMGVVVSIDDFGTGYSSMSYLRRFPIDKLKIDRSFISDLTSNTDAASIVQAIISLAHSLRLKVVAEGVETAEQLSQLRALGCDQFQGYYQSAAVLPEEIEALARAAPPQLAHQSFQSTQSKLAAFKRR